VALNCAAIPKDLLEAEIFGVERGAFTGAVKARAGLVEQAADGTLFLDEIGEMDISLQPKLLRFLETRIARRVGSETEYKSSARVVSATNRYLRAESEAGRFRLDLYYRLAEISLSVPPLRERREDIAPLAHIFLRQANERFGKNIEYCEPELIQRFMLYDWPGNARELKSTIDRLVLLYDGPVLRASWWELAESGGFRPTTHEPAPTLPASPAGSPPATSTPVALNRQQKYDLARRLLAESANNYTWVASQLGVNSSTLWRWRHLGKI
jgi:transcriptional regulator with PAS, ATPase and Fis domain